MIESRFLADPFTRTAANVLGELTITADNGMPVNEASCNIIFAAANERGPRSIAIMGRVSGTAEAPAIITLRWYLFHSVSKQFYQAARLETVGSTGITDTVGNIWVLNHNPQCQKGYLQAVGIVANQDLHVIFDVVAV